MDFRLLLGLAFLFGLFWIPGFLTHILSPAYAVSSPKWLWLICGAPPTGRRLTGSGVASQITAYCIPPVLLYARDHFAFEQSLLAFIVCVVAVHILVLVAFRLLMRG